MSRDPSTGVDPTATDGEPDENEIARRRAARDAKKAAAKPRARRAAAASEGSLSERAQTAPLEEDADGQISVALMGEIAGDGITLARLIKAGMGTKTEVSMMSASIPGARSGGLLPPEGTVLLVVEVEVAKYEPVPQRDRKGGEAKLKDWLIRQHCRPVHVQRADSAAGRAMLGLPPLDQAAAG